jgi:hypothetical protein
MERPKSTKFIDCESRQNEVSFCSVFPFLSISPLFDLSVYLSFLSV